MFNCIESIGNIDEQEMFRTFNMGIGMIVVASKSEVAPIKNLINVQEIGKVEEGMREVRLL